MVRNDPRRNYFNPEMILKNFSNAKEQVWVNDGTCTYHTQIRNVFVIRDLYAKWDWARIPEGADYEEFLASVPRTYEYEDHLANIESEAEPVITAIIEQARCQNSLVLEPRQRDVLKRFVFALAHRTPEAQNRAAIFSGYTDAFYEVVKKDARLNNYPLPDKESFYEDPRFRHISDMALSNTRARFAAGDNNRLENDDLRFARETGVAVAVIRDQCVEFVLGSHGLTLLEHSLPPYLPAISWLPVAPDIAVGITTWPDRDVLTELSAQTGGTEIVSLINRSTADLSERIVGASEALVRSLK